MDNCGNILIVDDDRVFRQSLLISLSSMGYAVDDCSGAIDAYSMISTRNYDLVISDIRMPHGDGLELLVKLRKMNPMYPSVVLMTGYTNESFQKLLDLGAVAILRKPFEIDELENVLTMALSRMKEIA